MISVICLFEVFDLAITPSKIVWCKLKNQRGGRQNAVKKNLWCRFQHRWRLTSVEGKLPFKIFNIITKVEPLVVADVVYKISSFTKLFNTRRGVAVKFCKSAIVNIPPRSWMSWTTSLAIETVVEAKRIFGECSQGFCKDWVCNGLAFLAWCSIITEVHLPV